MIKKNKINKNKNKTKMSNDEFGNYFPTSKVIAFLKSYDDKQM